MAGDFPPFTKVAVDPAVADVLIQSATMAAMSETLKSRPVSRVKNPDGTAQLETQAEYDKRIVTEAVMYLLELGWVTVPEDIVEKFDEFVPLDRASF